MSFKIFTIGMLLFSAFLISIGVVWNHYQYISLNKSNSSKNLSDNSNSNGNNNNYNKNKNDEEDIIPVNKISTDKIDKDIQKAVIQDTKKIIKGSKTRTAIIMSGGIRTLHVTWDSIKMHLIDTNNADVFAALIINEKPKITPNDINYDILYPNNITLNNNNTSNHEELSINNIRKNIRNRNRKLDIEIDMDKDLDNSLNQKKSHTLTNITLFISELKKQSSIKNLEIIDGNDNDMKQLYDDNNANGRILMSFKGIQRANYLKKDYEIKNNIKYDYVIRLRPDILLSPVIAKTFNVESFIKKTINKNSLDNTIAIPFCMNYGLTKIQRTNSINIFGIDMNINSIYGANDQIALGSNHAMNIYSDTFISATNIIKSIPNLYNIRMQPEWFLKQHFIKNNISIAPLLLLPAQEAPPKSEWNNCTNSFFEDQKICDIRETGYQLCQNNDCIHDLLNDMNSDPLSYRAYTSYIPKSCRNGYW